MLLQNGAKQIMDLVDLEDETPNFLLSVSLQVRTASGGLVWCDISVDRNLGEVFATARDVGRHKGVWADERCWLRTVKNSHGTH